MSHPAGRSGHRRRSAVARGLRGPRSDLSLRRPRAGARLLSRAVRPPLLVRATGARDGADHLARCRQRPRVRGPPGRHGLVLGSRSRRSARTGDLLLAARPLRTTRRACRISTTSCKSRPSTTKRARFVAMARCGVGVISGGVSAQRSGAIRVSAKLVRRRSRRFVQWASHSRRGTSARSTASATRSVLLIRPGRTL